MLTLEKLVYEQKQPKGPLGPGQGAATFASTIQDIEARYGGGRVVQERGYERDGFVVSDVRPKNALF